MPTEIRSAQLRANGLRHHLLRAGEGPPLLLLHGWPEAAFAWRRLIPRLAGRFELIAPDFRGFGESENPHPGPYPVTAEMLAADMLALLDALGLERVGVVSHDVGSNVAQEMARRAPARVRGLFFFSVTYPGIGNRWLDPGHAGEIWYQAFNRLPLAMELVGHSRETCRAFLRHCLSHWSHDPRAFDGELEAWVDNFMRPGNLQGGFNWYHGSHARRLAVMRGEVPPQPPIAQPTHVLWGESDRVLLPAWRDRLSEFFADVTVETAPRAGHFVHHERPDLAAERIAAFFGALP